MTQCSGATTPFTATENARDGRWSMRKRSADNRPVDRGGLRLNQTATLRLSPEELVLASPPAPEAAETKEERSKREVGAADLEVFAEFYAGTISEVYAYLYRRCGGVHSVTEELTQETYLAAVATIKAGKGKTISLPWLIGVARHKLIDYYRKQERDTRKLTLVAESIATEAPPVEDDVAERARAALDKVSGMQHAALVLRYLDDLSVPEVAQALDKTIHATESLLARGRASFKRNYQETAGA